jgi:hypothetical protein
MVTDERQATLNAQVMQANTTTGASSEGINDGVISASPVSPNAFLVRVSKPLPKMALVVTPPKRHPKTVALISCHNSQLVKKVCGCTPAVATT